jgi:hypothetical protein
VTARPPDAEHVTIYYSREHFAAWPFAHGLWAWPDGEVLVGFTRAPCGYQRPDDVRHRVVDGDAAQYVTLRSPDSGRTWPGESLQLLGQRGGLKAKLLEEAIAERGAQPEGELEGALDWGAPDFCLSAGFGIPPDEARDVGYVQLSGDRGRTWHGPFRIPGLGFANVQVKPDYLVRPDGLVLLFVTVARADPAGRHGGRYGSRFVAVYATPDGGRSWRYLSCILPGSPDTPFVERYYASPVLLPDGRILVALRCQLNGSNAWPEVYASQDGGWTWRFVSRVADWGGPTHLRRLEDGRLLAAYGYRVPPYGIRARASEDEGRTWGPELVLRDDGGSHDLGYPRTVPLPGGRIMAAYYFNRAADDVRCEGGVRHIAGTIFTP